MKFDAKISKNGNTKYIRLPPFLFQEGFIDDKQEFDLEINIGNDNQLINIVIIPKDENI
jgi:antitoxin component of MazEF toxin-antitoxin module